MDSLIEEIKEKPGFLNAPSLSGIKTYNMAQYAKNGNVSFVTTKTNIIGNKRYVALTQNAK